MGNRFGDVVKEKTQSGDSQAAKDAGRAATGEDAADTKRLNVRVPEPLYEAYKEKVEGEGRTMTWVVLQHMREYLDDE
mgnify:CR=1 FL=1